MGTRTRGSQRDSRSIDLADRRPAPLLASRRHFPFETTPAATTDVASTASLTAAVRLAAATRGGLRDDDLWRDSRGSGGLLQLA